MLTLYFFLYKPKYWIPNRCRQNYLFVKTRYMFRPVRPSPLYENVKEKSRIKHFSHLLSSTILTSVSPMKSSNIICITNRSIGFPTQSMKQNRPVSFVLFAEQNCMRQRIVQAQVMPKKVIEVIAKQLKKKKKIITLINPLKAKFL